MNNGLRLMTYDNTDWESGLTQSWFAGGGLYRLFRAIDLVKPVTSWAEALDWLATVEPSKKIDVWQFWGHGSPATAYVDYVPLNGLALEEGHPLHAPLLKLKERLHPKSLVWFRTCSTFHGPRGKKFAEDLANFLGCRVAAHTFVVGPLQSGLHSIGPGEAAGWPDEEGLDPKRGGIKMSGPFDPNTITCLRASVPKGW